MSFLPGPGFPLDSPKAAYEVVLRWSAFREVVISNLIGVISLAFNENNRRVVFQTELNHVLMIL